jgi:hypothetical protein
VIEAVSRKCRRSPQNRDMAVETADGAMVDEAEV